MRHKSLLICLCVCNVFASLAQDFSETYPTTPRDLTDNAIDHSKPSERLKSASRHVENHKPMFKQCSTYNPQVAENQDRGVHVFRVEAEDLDPPDTKEGRLTYQINHREGEKRALFIINATTGDIYTNTQLERDYPVKQKELYVTVQAKDGGVPPFADVCSFKVTVTDVNDNSPTFDQQEWKASIAEDLNANAEVLRVFAYDFDEGENSRLTYSFVQDRANFNEYFRIDPNTGVVYLRGNLRGKQGIKFTSTVSVQDNGAVPNFAYAEISILVVGSGKKAPTFIRPPVNTHFNIREHFHNYDAPLILLEAESNIDDKRILYDLIRGKTTQTNKDNTFLLDTINSTTAAIKLGRPLDYEQITEYSLTVKVRNKDFLEATTFITIYVMDDNDEIPSFIELLKGSIVENDVIGAQAMTVRAIDKDGTSPNNKVQYELLNYQDQFEIGESTGVITAKTQFDREDGEKVYLVKVRAYDGAPSVLYANKSLPNAVVQTFPIDIEDRNDNKPMFVKSYYSAGNISESTDQFSPVIMVTAEDKDSASVIIYSIIEGNVDDAFMIEETTGRIKVNGKLDYEKIERYNLTVRAFDGIFEDTAKVVIDILNENDELPVFEHYLKNVTILEETIPTGCITILKAYDPDIKDRHADQRIVYAVQKAYPFLAVDSQGCVTLTMKMDRDPPHGAPVYQAYVEATDNNGAGLTQPAEITINLEDINDNAPILNFTQVTWRENQDPGTIIKLEAIDYDSDENGPPFTYEMANDFDSLNDKFTISGGHLMALVSFDREQQKFYDVSIKITDNANSKPHPLSGISKLRVIIGDENDNEAKDGSSEIFVYKYEDLREDITIGRVYVEDPDDWDLPDKFFTLESGSDYFSVASFGGYIQMRSDAEAGSYPLNFTCREEALPKIPSHTVNAHVTVTVKEIPREAVVKSGSIRMEGITTEALIVKNEKGLSKKDVLQMRLAKTLNTSLENVDVFTVLPAPSNASLVDVRFSAHGSPYYAAEKLNYKVTGIQKELETEMGADFLMISINECMLGHCGATNSCTSTLDIDGDKPAVVYTNRTSFVGITAKTTATCSSLPRPTPDHCLNGGTITESGGCLCPDGFEGPFCEILGIGFSGDGWAMYETLDAWNQTVITLSVLTQNDDGLIFFAGPLTVAQTKLTHDFISLELKDGYVVLKVNLGNETEELVSKHKRINDGAMHNIRITLNPDDSQLSVDECGSDCLKWITFSKNNRGLLNVNGPLQVGGRVNTMSFEEAKQIWSNPPTSQGFMGCVKNFTYNNFVYNLGSPSDSYHAYINCNYGVMVAVSFGIDSNFLVAILVCIATLLILLLAVVVHKRKQDNLNEKDMDDTRENIINYEDEGGGESDTNFDLSVLRPSVDEKLPLRENLYKQAAEVPADIGTFLEAKKMACDKDNLPYDDVRHYGYEGDGNTSGSLSSLASCTDEGDLKFNYLSSFGPRFRKLADMYGDDASEEASQNGEESWC